MLVLYLTFLVNLLHAKDKFSNKTRVVNPHTTGHPPFWIRHWVPFWIFITNFILYIHHWYFCFLSERQNYSLYALMNEDVCVGIIFWVIIRKKILSRNDFRKWKIWIDWGLIFNFVSWICEFNSHTIYLIIVINMM